MSNEFEKMMRDAERRARGLPPPKRTPSSLTTAKPPRNQIMQSTCGWETAFEEPPPSVGQLIRLIRSFHGLELMESLCHLSFLYHHRRNQGRLLDAPKGCYDEKSFAKLQRAFTRGDTAWVSRATILYLQQLVLRFGNFKAGKPVKGDLHGVGRIILAASEHSEGKETRELARRHKDLATDESRMAFGGYFFSNFYLNRLDELVQKLGRYWACFHRYPIEIGLPASFAADIASVAGVNAEDYLATTFMLLSHYIKDDKDFDGFMANPENFILRPAYFEKLPPATREKVGRVLETLASPRDDFRKLLRKRKSPKSGYQSSVLFDKPLLSVDGSVIPFDIGFLADQASNGLESRVRVGLRKTDKAAHGSFSKSWGQIIERHARGLIEYHLGDAHGKRLFYETDQKPDTSPRTDFVIRDGSDLAFIEVSKSGVPPMASLSLSWPEINSSIEKVLFQTADGNKGKALQISQAIENFRSGKLQIGGIDPKEIKRIFPVLVLEHGIPQLPPVTGYLRDQISKRTSLGAHAEPVEFWDLQELELVAPLMKAGITDIIARKQAGSFAHFPLKNFIAADMQQTERSGYMFQLFEQARDDIERHLFGDKVGGE
jgi:hypothetical protein